MCRMAETSPRRISLDGSGFVSRRLGSTAEQGRPTDQRSWRFEPWHIGDSAENFVGWPVSDRIHAAITQAVYTLLPCQQHPFACVLELRKIRHFLSDQRNNIRD